MRNPDQAGLAKGRHTGSHVYVGHGMDPVAKALWFIENQFAGDISLAEGFVEDDTLECWAHGSKFSLKTGKPLTLPAYEPVPVFQVEVKDGDVHIDPSVTLTV